MTEDDLQNWFDIGDSKNKKQDQKHSPKGRLRTGAKALDDLPVNKSLNL